MNYPKELILYTSGSTSGPKEVKHNTETIKQMVQRSIKESKMTSDDIVLNVMPGNVIGFYSLTALPAMEVGATLINTPFDPYEYLRLFNKYRPTVIGLIPRMIEVLEKTKGFQELDMSCVRYMLIGGQNVYDGLMEKMLSKGVQHVSTWYGMTEFPPPIFVGDNSNVFDFEPREGYTIDFTEEGECIVNGQLTGDIFDLNTRKFSHRKTSANGTTWKTDVPGAT